MNKDELRRRFKEQVLQKNTNIECKTSNSRIEVTYNSEDESYSQKNIEEIPENHSIESNLTLVQQDTEPDSVPISEPVTVPITETLLEKAKKGDVVSMLELGKSYFRGKNGYPRSYKDAALWYLQAAKEGSAEAQYRLGRCCEDGKGVEQSNKEAMMWFALASKQNNPQAKERLEKLKVEEEKRKEQEKENALQVIPKQESQYPANRASYIKIEDPSLTNLPVFAEILNIIRAIACFDINEYTGTCDYCWYNWYEKLPEKIQLHYGVRPELPPKERFEYVGDLIKYIIQKNELNNTQKIKSVRVSTDNYIPIAVSAIATLIFSFIYLYLISENTYSTGFWDGLNSGFNLILYFFGAPILTAAITWWAYDSFWPNRDLGFFGYLLRLYGYTILLSFIPQWWLVLLVGGIEYMYCQKNV